MSGKRGQQEREGKPRVEGEREPQRPPVVQAAPSGGSPAPDGELRDPLGNFSEQVGAYFG